jgi:peptide chain release factor 1
VRDAAATHSGGGGGGDSDAPASSASASASSSAGSGETCGQGAAAELAKMAEDELAELRPALAAAEARLVRLLLPADEADARDAILEVRMGVGGEESCLFAGELLAMYEGYAALKGWKWKLLSSTTEQGFGGIREAVVSVESSGGGGGGGAGAGADEGAPAAGAFGRLRFESGVHRVQRVPVTQSTGKLQTSTATVAVLPEAEEVDIELRAADLRIDTYRAGGPGGQGVNTTDSAVRITHLPTGLVVAIQDERSQIQNRAKALRVLRARLFDAERERNESARREARSAQVGSSARSERVRTYNFSQNRVTDHRCGESRFDIAAFMRGEELDGIIDALAKLKEEEELGALEARHKAESAGQEGSKAKGKK